MNTVSVLDLAEAGDLALFHNQAIDRRLGIQEIRDIYSDKINLFVLSTPGSVLHNI